MKILDYSQLGNQDKKILDETKKIAKNHSVIKKSTWAGAIIVGNKGGLYKGATIGRTRAIGSTCSERMALDSLYFHKKEYPVKVFTIGTFERREWNDSFICTPCGVCLEMLFEASIFFNIEKLDFVCSSWDKTKILKADLQELFPQIGKGKWRRD